VNGQTTYDLYGASEGGHPIAEYAGGGWYREAIMGGVRWGWLYQNGDGRFTLPDALGSTAVLAQDGTVQASRLYPFGEEAQATSAEYKWTNQIRDANALDHFAFRTYSSNLARWLSPDPAGLAAANPAEPSSWNRYAYVENRPLSAVDPLGLTCPSGSCASIEGEVLTILNTYGAGNGCSVNGVDTGCAQARAVAASGDVDLAANNSGISTTTAAANFTAPPGTSAATLAAAEQRWAAEFGTANFTSCENAADSATGYSVVACQVVALAIDSNDDPVLSGFQFFNPSADYRQFSFSTPYSPVEASARLQAAGYSPDTIDWVHGSKVLNFRENTAYCSVHFVLDPAGPGVGGTLHVDTFNPLFFSATSQLGAAGLVGHGVVDWLGAPFGFTGAGCPAL